MNAVTKPPTSETDQTRLHCYAACWPDIAVPEERGVAGAAVALLADGPVAVLASPLPHGVEPGDRESLEAHGRVMLQAFGAGVVLPFRFPTVAPSRSDTVTQFMRPLRRSILRALDRLEGREEVRLRVTYEEDASVAEILSAIPPLARMRGRTEGALQLGEGIVLELRQWAQRDAEAVLRILRPLAVDVKIDALGGERDVLVASVLAPRGTADGIAAVVQLWASSRPRIRVWVSGPLPPYSFAEFE